MRRVLVTVIGYVPAVLADVALLVVVVELLDIEAASALMITQRGSRTWLQCLILASRSALSV